MNMTNLFLQFLLRQEDGNSHRVIFNPLKPTVRYIGQEGNKRIKDRTKPEQRQDKEQKKNILGFKGLKHTTMT